MGGKFVFWRSQPEWLVEGCLAMAGVCFLESLWEKPIWEGVWPNLDPMDSVCLRTASVSGMCHGSIGRTARSFSS